VKAVPPIEVTVSPGVNKLISELLFNVTLVVTTQVLIKAQTTGVPEDLGEKFQTTLATAEPAHCSTLAANSYLPLTLVVTPTT
jgi:hypothetical protein